MVVPHLGWLDRIVGVQWGGKPGYLLQVFVGTGPVLSTTFAFAQFDDPTIGVVVSGNATFPANGRPDSEVPIVEPPTAAVKKAYTVWRVPTLVTTNIGVDYQVTQAGGYFDMGKLDVNELVANVFISGMGTPDLVFGISGTLYDPKGNVVATDGTGSAGLGATGTLTITANIKARTCVASRA